MDLAKNFRPCWPAALALLVATQAHAMPVRTEAQAIRRVSAAIDTYRLTSVRQECRLLFVTELRTRFEFTIREDHRPHCGGDPLTAPRLFSVRVRKRDGWMTTDAYDSVDYRPLNRKLGKR